MGWSDVSISLNGLIVHNLVEHFVDRWNFIYGEKYASKDPGKYARLSVGQVIAGHGGQKNPGLRFGGPTHDFMAMAQRELSVGRDMFGNAERKMHREHRRDDSDDNQRDRPQIDSGGKNANIQLIRR